jgi:hypothetical protein
VAEREVESFSTTEVVLDDDEWDEVEARRNAQAMAQIDSLLGLG